MKILFGGSFDPIHMGHLLLIQGTIELLDPEVFIIVPTFQSAGKKPHKYSPSERIIMTRAAINDIPKEFRDKIRFSLFEVLQGRTVYTWETIKETKVDAIIVGGDRDYTKWRNFSVIDDMIKTFLIYPRNGKPGKARKKEIILNLPQFDISSTEIRRRIENDKCITNLVPPSLTKEFINGLQNLTQDEKNRSCQTHSVRIF